MKISVNQGNVHVEGEPKNRGFGSMKLTDLPRSKLNVISSQFNDANIAEIVESTDKPEIKITAGDIGGAITIKTEDESAILRVFGEHCGIGEDHNYMQLGPRRSFTALSETGNRARLVDIVAVIPEA